MKPIEGFIRDKSLKVKSYLIIFTGSLRLLIVIVNAMSSYTQPDLFYDVIKTQGAYLSAGIQAIKKG
jgi:hypothetical protein